MLRSAKVELLQLFTNLKRKGSHTLPRTATLCTGYNLNQGDAILKSLIVRVSAERSGMLEIILSHAKLQSPVTPVFSYLLVL